MFRGLDKYKIEKLSKEIWQIYSLLLNKSKES